MDEQSKNQFEEIKRKLDQLEVNVNSIKRAVNKFESDYLKTDYTQMEGIAGKFDGYFMVNEQGERFVVPENYAAKSKLVYGDVLKMIEENGKQLFKQVERVNRKKVDGILTKKEGEWYLLTDRGSYKVSDVAAQFQNAQLNIQTTALLPADNLNAPFATIDVVEGFRTRENIEKPGKKELKVEEGKTGKLVVEKREPIKRVAGKETTPKIKPLAEKPVAKRSTERKSVDKKPAAKKPVERKGVDNQPVARKLPPQKEEDTTIKKEIIDEDDLI